MKQKTLWALGLMAGAGAAAYFGRRWVLANRARTSAHKVIPDVAGNYDIDGVSFDRDSREVVVSGDATHGDDPKRAALLH